VKATKTSVRNPARAKPEATADVQPSDPSGLRSNTRPLSAQWFRLKGSGCKVPTCLLPGFLPPGFLGPGRDVHRLRPAWLQI
jgi:hypothetical protein